MVSPAGTFFIVLFVLLFVAAASWVVFTQLRARRLGLPPPTLSSYNPFARKDTSAYGAPSPAPGGIRGWFSDRIAALRGSNNSRSAQGAYEQPLNSGGPRRGFGPLDPDEAWDARVGHESDYGPYEQELSGYSSNARGRGFDDPNPNPYGRGHGYNDHYDEERGRPRSRSPGAPAAPNPFDDTAAEPSNMSLRGVSPRPLDTSAANRHSAGAHTGGSPTSERRSIFRENV